jgi:tRNA A-37 threonylcarbamoyl transferase component Bud32
MAAVKLKAATMLPNSPSLLERAKDLDDPQAWNQLQALYSPILVRFSRTQGMRHDDAEDIAVGVLEQWRKEVADWDFSTGIEAVRSHLRGLVVSRTARYQRVTRQRSLLCEAPGIPQDQRLSTDAAFDWIWTQEHLWQALRQLDTPNEDPWQRTKQVLEQLNRLNSLEHSGAPTSPVRLGELRRQIEQAGPYPEKRAVDPYADPLPTGWIPGLITLAELGRGEQGVAYLALHPHDGTKVMIKVFHRAYSDDPERRTQIENAVRHAQTLHHPHLVPIYGLGLCQNGQLFVAMRHLEGCTLEQALNGGYPGIPQASEMQWLGWVRQATEGVAHAHQHGLLHLGLHPRNVVIDEDRNARVVDFGLPSVSTREHQADALTDLAALAEMLPLGLDQDTPHNDPGSMSTQQRAGTRAILRQCQKLRDGSIYHLVNTFRDDLTALETGGEIRARMGDKLYRFKRFARARMGSAALLLLALSYGLFNQQAALNGRQVKLEAAERESEVRGLIDEVFATMQLEAMRSLQPQSSHLQLQQLAQKYVKWLQQVPRNNDRTRLDVAAMLMLIAEAQSHSTRARQPDSPSALLTLGDVHETIPEDFEVDESWNRDLDRAADLKVRAWLLADEIYRQRGNADDLRRRKQCLEELWRHCRVERRHWSDQASSLLRRLRVELAWMRFHVDSKRWGMAAKNQLQLADLMADWMKMRSAAPGTPLPDCLDGPLERVTVDAAQTMIEAGMDLQAWPWLWNQVSIDKQLRRANSEQIKLCLHRISIRRSGQAVADGPNLPIPLRWLHRVIAIGANVSKENSGT